MTGCFVPLLALVLAVFVLLSVLRWFEQVTEAVDLGWWNKVTLLVLMPFAAWLFPSRVSAGRPTAVPRHEPVRGFGAGPAMPPPRDSSNSVAAGEEPPPVRAAPRSHAPPPGTPAEFIGMPKIPPKRPATAGSRAAIDPEKIAKLRQKMIEQGMLKPDERDDKTDAPSGE